MAYRRTRQQKEQAQLKRVSQPQYNLADIIKSDTVVPVKSQSTKKEETVTEKQMLRLMSSTPAQVWGDLRKTLLVTAIIVASLIVAYMRLKQ